MPDVGFKLMSFLIGLGHGFMDIEKVLERAGLCKITEDEWDLTYATKYF